MSLFNAHGHFVPLAQFRAALAKGANPNQLWISPRGSVDYTIRVPLVVAASSPDGMPFLLALLDEPRTDIEARNLEERSALMMAASHGLEPHAALLLSRGANLHAKDTYGRTALHHATQCEDDAMLRLLLDAGANPNDTNQAGRAALHEAMMAYTNFPRPLETKVRLLLDHGARVDQRGAQAATPLYEAATNGWSRIVAMLLEARLILDSRPKTASDPSTRSCANWLWVLAGRKRRCGRLTPFWGHMSARVFWRVSRRWKNAWPVRYGGRCESPIRIDRDVYVHARLGGVHSERE